MEWLLKEAKLLCIRIDNGANIVAAVRSLGWLWLNCFGHNLRPAVTSSVASESQHLSLSFGSLQKPRQHFLPKLATEEKAIQSAGGDPYTEAQIHSECFSDVKTSLRQSLPCQQGTSV